VFVDITDCKSAIYELTDPPGSGFDRLRDRRVGREGFSNECNLLDRALAMSSGLQRIVTFLGSTISDQSLLFSIGYGGPNNTYD
ncbi:hypothetical protein C0995_007308, partial [Termitomyces sp. Mi166